MQIYWLMSRPTSSLEVGEIFPIPTLPSLVIIKSLVCCVALGIPVEGLSFAASTWNIPEGD